jgi:hypothetical protein
MASSPNTSNPPWQGRILNAQGNPIQQPSHLQTPANTNYSGPPGPPGGDPMIDIAGLKTHVTWIERSLGALGLLGLAAFGWIFYNIYQPVQSLTTASAVQMNILTDITDDVKEIRERLNEAHDQPQGSPPAGQSK